MDSGSPTYFVYRGVGEGIPVPEPRAPSRLIGEVRRRPAPGATEVSIVIRGDGPGLFAVGGLIVSVLLGLLFVVAAIHVIIASGRLKKILRELQVLNSRQGPIGDDSRRI